MRGKLIAGAAVAGVAGLVPAVTQAVPLTYDLRLASGPTKAATVTTGDVVTLDLYAILDATDGTNSNDGFLLSHGSYQSVAGSPTVKGNFRGDVTGNPKSTVNNTSGFTGSLSQAGYQSDLDGDLDLDIGSLQTDAPAANPWFIANSNDLSGTTGASQFKIGSITFTVTSAAGGSTSLNYAPRNQLTGGTVGGRRNQQFTIDGVSYAVQGNGSGVKGGSTTITGAIALGAPVVLSIEEIPEPAGLGLLGIGAAALLRRRKA